jgi:preprotein translocase subunit SecD
MGFWKMASAGLAFFLLATSPVHAGKSDLSRLEDLLAGKAPRNRRIGTGPVSTKEGAGQVRTWVLHKEPVLTGAHVDDAKATLDKQVFQPQVSVTFNEEGARIFDRYTASHVRTRLGIVLEDHVLSAPVIMSRIPGGKVVITLGGGFRPHEDLKKEAEQLALVLRSGALPCPLEKLEESSSEKGLRLILGLRCRSSSPDRTTKKVVAETVAILKRRLYEAGAEEVSVTARIDLIVVDFPAGKDMASLLPLVTRSGRLEFVEVDDSVNITPKPEWLPDGVRSETESYMGPRSQALTTRYLQGKPETVRDVVLNVPEIQAWLRRHGVGKPLIEKITRLVRSPTATDQRDRILKMVQEAWLENRTEKGKSK